MLSWASEKHGTFVTPGFGFFFCVFFWSVVSFFVFFGSVFLFGICFLGFGFFCLGFRLLEGCFFGVLWICLFFFFEGVLPFLMV